MEQIVAFVQQNTYALYALIIWDLSWRMLALWYSARQNQKLWFVALMVVNSVGLLPLIYLVFISKDKFWIKSGLLK